MQHDILSVIVYFILFMLYGTAANVWLYYYFGVKRGVFKRVDVGIPSQIDVFKIGTALFFLFATEDFGDRKLRSKKKMFWGACVISAFFGIVVMFVSIPRH